MNHKVFIGLGSNVDRLKNIQSCIKIITNKYEKIKLSNIYETKSMGFNGPNFYNLACSFITTHEVHDLKKELNLIEQEHGRSLNETKFSSRTLDIDILYYDKMILSDGIIQIPRKEIIEYDFVLQPLIDLVPDFVHPELNISHREIMNRSNINQQIISIVDLAL